MSPEERQLLSTLFQRVESAAHTPRDPEAESLIADRLRQTPQTPYYLAQAVIVQEKGLEAAGKRIEELEASLRQLQQQLHEAAQPAEQKGGFLSSLFGASTRPQTALPAKRHTDYAPAADGPWSTSLGASQSPPAVQQPNGPWSAPLRTSSAGGSFLTGALGTAAGVAGGMLLAHSLSNVFGNHMAGLGLGNPTEEGFGTGPAAETVINNIYENGPAPDTDAASDAFSTAEDTDNRSANLEQADLDGDDGGDNDGGDWGDDGGSDGGGSDGGYA